MPELTRDLQRRGRYYSDDDKRRALDVYGAGGLATSARRCGVPKSTILRWADAAGIQRCGTEATQRAVEVRILSMAERRTRLADNLLALAEDRVGSLLRLEGRSLDPVVQVKMMTVAGIAIDKSQLLGGQATEERTAQLVPTRARIEALAAEIRRRMVLVDATAPPDVNV